MIRTRRALRALVLAWALVCCIVQTAWADELTLWHSYRGAEQETLEGLLDEWNQQHPELTVRPWSPASRDRL